jgi:hypothetical protein
MKPFPCITRCAALGALLSLAIPDVAAQTWTSVSPGGPMRSSMGLCYDSVRHRAVMFGGTPFLSDTREWNGTSWVQVATTGPGSLEGMAMAFDPVRGVSVIFGGYAPGPEFYTDDTWEWNGATWTQRVIGSPIPSERRNSAMVYDSLRDHMVLFGGETLNSWNGATWRYNGTSWAQLSTTGPSARYFHAMAYDSARDRVVLFGGAVGLPLPTAVFGDTWEWNGATNTWQLRSSSGPSPRYAHRMAYDSATGRVVLFGGGNLTTNLADTWEWNGTTWTQIAGAGPSTRAAHGMTYNTDQNRTILFGGYNGGSLLGDTWTYQGQPPAVAPTIVTHPQSQQAAEGSNVTFTVVANGTAPLAYQWRRNNVNIPGATSSSYTLFNVDAGDQASYRCLVSNSAGSALSNSGALTVFPDCNGNGISDATDVSSGASDDCNANGSPDECDTDNNANGVPDDCEGTHTAYGFCFAAPCGNEDPSGGCANSTGFGARLTGFGSASISADLLRFHATDLPPFATALLLVSDPATTQGTLFGDGRWVLNQTALQVQWGSGGALGRINLNIVDRLGHRFADSQGTADWGPGLGVTGFPGQVRAFQLLYRDPFGPCHNGFNLSNGVLAVLTP